LRIKGIGLGLLVVAGSLLFASASFAGVTGPNMRLDGTFVFEDDGAGDNNEACVTADEGFFGVQGLVSGTDGPCLVEIFYEAELPNKASGTVLKEGSGSAKVSQQVQSTVFVGISGEGCTSAPFEAEAFPEKCKASGQVNAEEPSQTVEKAKAKLTCDLGENLSGLDSPTPEQISTIEAAIAGRSDVKLSNGKLTINTKGVPNTGDHFCLVL
jgi:hypothetical protein